MNRWWTEEEERSVMSMGKLLRKNDFQMLICERESDEFPPEEKKHRKDERW